MKFSLGGSQKVFILVTCIFFWILVVIGLWGATFGPDYNEELRQYVKEENKVTIDYVNTEVSGLRDFVTKENERLFSRVEELVIPQ